jgi:hypothetical protein
MLLPRIATIALLEAAVSWMTTGNESAVRFQPG